MQIPELEKTTRRVLIWALVYSIPAFQAMLPVEDADLWWHLRTGLWIVEHGHVPMEDPFSSYGMGKTWIAYSWLFEVMVYVIYTRLGLVGIVLFTLVMSLLIAFTVHRLVRKARFPFAMEITLMAFALGSMKPIISPRSWLFSILFFALELLILFHVRRSGESLVLWVLPPLFALWANLHLQFIYGLAAIGFFVAEVLANRSSAPNMGERLSPIVPLRGLCFVAFACVLATFVTPYHYHLLRPIFEVSLQTGVFSNVKELHPLFFRTPADWFVLILTLAAVYVLGWERRWQIFPLLLLAMGVMLGFRARRDAWVIVLAAVAIIGEFREIATSADSLHFTKPRIAAIAMAVMLFTYLIASHREITNQHLETAVEDRFPVKAANFIIENGYPGPLFNNFDWGGYLIWHLRALPVSIDNRGNVHGDQRIERSLATWSGSQGWNKDPDLMKARLVIAEVWRPLVSLLRSEQRFKLVYEDSTAAVFVAANKSH
jgi:hypothetical protein